MEYPNSDTPYKYKDAGLLTYLLVMLLGLIALVGAVERFFPDEADSFDSWAGLAITGVGVFDLLSSLLLTPLVFLVWVYRASTNIHAIGTKGLQFSPGWAVGWFFVPLLNFIKPLNVMREIYLASLGRGLHEDAPSVPRWWFIWLFSMLGGLATIVPERLLNLAAIIAAVLAIRLVNKVYSGQRNKAEALGMLVANPSRCLASASIFVLTVYGLSATLSAPLLDIEPPPVDPEIVERFERQTTYTNDWFNRVHWPSESLTPIEAVDVELSSLGLIDAERGEIRLRRIPPEAFQLGSIVQRDNEAIDAAARAALSYHSAISVEHNLGGERAAEIWALRYRSIDMARKDYNVMATPNSVDERGDPWLPGVEQQSYLFYGTEGSPLEPKTCDSAFFGRGHWILRVETCDVVGGPERTVLWEGVLDALGKYWAGE